MKNKICENCNIPLCDSYDDYEACLIYIEESQQEKNNKNINSEQQLRNKISDLIDNMNNEIDTKMMKYSFYKADDMTQHLMIQNYCHGLQKAIVALEDILNECDGK